MVYLDDSIMQKGCPATAGSKMLENFISLFDATIIKRLNENTNRVKLAEFGLKDPGEKLPSPLLCNDVFGYIRSRAAKEELCYIRPTYGTVSRFGLVPAASSMDQIGIVCKDPIAGFDLLSAIAGHDENDGAMFPEKSYSYKSEKSEIRWGILQPSGTESIPITETLIEKISAKEKVIDCNVNCAGASSQVLCILAYAEISNNLSRYDGIKFGYRTSDHKNLDDLYTKSRTEAFGPEAKFASVMGCFLLSQDNYAVYYEKAMKIRRLIKESLRFDTYDVIILPADDPIPVLAGLPSLTFSYNGNGIQLAANVKKEGLLQAAWETVQS